MDGSMPWRSNRRSKKEIILGSEFNVKEVMALNTSLRHAKASLLLYLIYYHGRSTDFHFENVAFFQLNDEKVCDEFSKKLNVNKKEFEDLIDLLFEKGLIRFTQNIDALYVNLNDQACNYVLSEDFADRPYLLRVDKKNCK